MICKNRQNTGISERKTGGEVGVKRQSSEEKIDKTEQGDEMRQRMCQFFRRE